MVVKKKIDITFVRTKKTMEKYLKAVEQFRRGEKKPFDGEFENPIAEFKHWVIIKNAFPYDSFAEVHHLIFTKRKVDFNWDKLTDEEIQELNEIKKTYASEHYDAIWENLPKAQSAPGHFHLHLLKLKRVQLDPESDN